MSVSRITGIFPLLPTEPATGSLPADFCEHQPNVTNTVINKTTGIKYPRAVFIPNPFLFF
jgi:hypothetical protein